AANTYSMIKVATEAAVRTMSRALSLPTTIARLGMVYGTAGHGGVPTIIFKRMLAGESIPKPKGNFYYAPIAESYVVNQVEPLLAAASVPPVIVNWASNDMIEEGELYDYIARVSGVTPVFAPSTAEGTDFGGMPDTTRLKAIAGLPRVDWRKGI